MFSFSRLTESLLNRKRLKALKISEQIISMSYLRALVDGFMVVFLDRLPKTRTSRLRSQWRTKQFGKIAHVVPMRLILNAFPNIDAHDIYGNKVSVSYKNLDKCFCVYSGMYELVNCLIHQGEMDVDLYIHNFSGIHPLTEIKQLYSRDWDEDDVREYNANIGVIPYGQYEKKELLKQCFGLNPNVAEYVLSFNDDSFSKKRSVSLTYNESHAQRGFGIFKAIMMNFGGAEEMKRRELLDAVVYAYDRASDEDKAVFARNMKLFMATMPDDIREEMLSLVQMKEGDFLKEYINKLYVKFCKEHSSEELQKLDIDVESKTEAYIEDIHKKQTGKRSKIGYVHEILRHNGFRRIYI